MPTIWPAPGANASAWHHVGTAFSRQGATDVGRVRDDALLAPGLEESDESANLRPHASPVELVLRVIASCLADRHSVEPALVGLVEVDGDLFYAGRDHQKIGAHPRRQEARCQVFVDHCLGAGEPAVRTLDHRDAAAAAGNHYIP